MELNRCRQSLPPTARGSTALLVLTAAVAAGCGTPSAPQPPTLDVARQVDDLEAQRTADTVRLSWTMPERTTDKVMLKGPVRAYICRTEGSGPCEPVLSRPFAPASPASFDDRLPTALLAGAAQLLTYRVELRNHAGKTAGPSNAAYTASGAAPPPLTGLHAEVRKEGVVLAWRPVATPEGAAADVRIERVPLSAGKTSQPKPQGAFPALAAPQETAQTLLVRAQAAQPETTQSGTLSETKPGTGAVPERALDRTAHKNESYTYTAQRVKNLSLDGHAIEVPGGGEGPITVEVKDVFPPAKPTGLTSAADTEEHAIDLSWTPNPEGDVAGYAVYRREAGGTGTAERISDAHAPVTTPSFRDTAAAAGVRYAYSITAVDRNGNESAHSGEQEEMLPR